MTDIDRILAERYDRRGFMRMAGATTLGAAVLAACKKAGDEGGTTAGLRVPSDGVVFVHEPDPCCHNETRAFLAMWHEGSTVVTIEIAGEGARESDVPELLSQLDQAV